MTNELEFLGYDRDGDVVFQLPNGRIWCSLIVQDVARARERGERFWERACTEKRSMGVPADDFYREFGPIQKERSRHGG